MADKDGKTEKPSAKKLKDARKKGDIVKSPELVSAISFFIFSVFFIPLWEYVIEKSVGILKLHFSFQFNHINIEENLNAIAIQSIVKFLIILAPFLAIGFFSSWISSMSQVGFLFTTKPLKPDFKKLNPISGFKNLVSKKAFFTLFKNIGKLILIFFITLKEIKNVLIVFFTSYSVGVETLPEFVLSFLKTLSIKIAFILLILGILDYVVQWFEYRKKLKMTKQEVKDEFKQQEGDQQVKAQRKGLYYQMVSGMMNQVKDATVIVTNPTHLAIAIRYNKESDGAPIVIAKGADHMAKKIREEATENRVPILENKPVARSLYKTTGIGEPIPVDMYETMAEILAFVYQMNEKNKYKI
ncbi:EscU/YscU/HrcU family type III secretion system export apparatus switch protein [Vagococcus fluvialis]|uniref:EscU/YscU/HrcU family type III secretion system export apparatus switch protein n=1 Tax=Vagococcus fluvialis TaxID=2738 RepID=UPI003D0D0372